MQSRVEQCLDEIRREYESSRSQVSALQQRLRTFNSQEEVKRANEYADRVRRMSLHMFSEKEQEADAQFRKEHFASCQSGRRASSYEYVLTGTGIGTAITIRCPVCGKEENITDYSNW